MRFFLPIVVVIVFLNCVGAQPPPVPPDTLETLKLRTDKMERYVSFKVTQSIFKYTGNPNGIIRGVSRTVTEDKYKFPGGLVWVSGWRSLL